MMGRQAQARSNSPPTPLDSLVATMTLRDEKGGTLPSAFTEPFRSSPTQTGPRTPLISPVSFKARSAPSLSAKRGAHQLPGTIDLSSLPRFPSSEFQPLNGGTKTPQAVGMAGSNSTGAASTPRAGLGRPGLFSRWSTDSEGGSSQSSPASCEVKQSACEKCTSAESESAAMSACSSCSSSSSKRTQRGAESPSSTRYNPFFLSPSASSNAFILPPVPVDSPSLSFAPSSRLAHLPPAPKPHQHGFSPCVEMSPTSPSKVSVAGGKSGRLQRQEDSGNGASEDGFSSGSDASGSSRSSSPASSPKIRRKASNFKLTRSKGLGLRDDSGRPQRSRWSKSLAAGQTLAQQQQAASSNTQKTATALLDGTISPAATTTDPLRVKLRNLPGAHTPDVNGMPAPPAAPAMASSSSRSSTLHVPMPNYNSGYKGAPHPPSPLHMCSYPLSRAESTEGSLFSTEFSFDKTVPAMDARMKSPRSKLPSDSLASQPMRKENPYFAGFV